MAVQDLVLAMEELNPFHMPMASLKLRSFDLAMAPFGDEGPHAVDVAAHHGLRDDHRRLAA